MAPQLVRGLFSGCRLDMSGISEEEEGEGRKEGVCVCKKNEKKAPSQHELGDVGLPCGRGTCHLVMHVVKNNNNIVSKQTVGGW